MKPITEEEMQDALGLAMNAGPDRVKGFIELSVDGLNVLLPVDEIAEAWEANQSTKIYLKHRRSDHHMAFQGTIQDLKRKIWEAQQ